MMKFKHLMAGLAVAGLALSPQPASAWSGCGVGVGAAMLDGEISGIGGPINIGSDGQAIGGRLSCDAKLGSFLIGLNVDYDYLFGDLESLGIKTDLSGGLRAGVIVSDTWALYGTGGVSRLDTSFGMYDGWYLGGGIMGKLPNSPLYLSLEYTHRIYDVSSIAPPGVDATVDRLRLGLDFKFNVPAMSAFSGSK